MNAVYLHAIGLAAPGLAGWEKARAVLRGDEPHVATALAPHAPALLPANERRRATPAVRLAFQAAEDAMKSCALPAARLATVFASSDADLAIIHRISSALANTPRLISPTDFHNSVHNAAGGYWHIATASHRASSTICAYDGSFAAGLLESCVQVAVDGHDVLFVAFDLPAPEPLHSKRPMSHPASVALVLGARPEAGMLATLSCAATRDESETAMACDALESLRTGNPASRALPLLALVARGKPGRVVLPAANGNLLAVTMTPA
jgi:hypothetical protein